MNEEQNTTREMKEPSYGYNQMDKSTELSPNMSVAPHPQDSYETKTRNVSGGNV